MKKSILICSVLSVGLLTTNFAQADLSSELAAVVAAEAEGKRAEAAAAKKARERAAAKAAEVARQKERAYQEYLKDKQRDQAYEDEIRKLDLEERRLALKRQQKRVEREDDFIEQELKREAARTDVIQSEADANRSISRGAESLMNKEGEARVKKESGWFK